VVHKLFFTFLPFKSKHREFLPNKDQITNDTCKNLTLPTVKKQETVKNQTDSFITSVTAVKQLVLSVASLAFFNFLDFFFIGQ